MKNNKIILFLTIFSLTFSGIYIFTNKIPEAFAFGVEIMDFFYTVAISTIAASIFYLFQIFIPEKKKMEIAIDNFKLNYTSFKNDCTSIFLSSINISHDQQLLEKLLNVKEFDNYFKEVFEQSETRWQGVLNKLGDPDNFLLKDLSIQFEILSQETDFFLNNISLYDREIFDFLKKLKNTTLSLKHTNTDWDEGKKLSNFFLELFAGRSFTPENNGKDIFEEMLKKISNNI